MICDVAPCVAALRLNSTPVKTCYHLFHTMSVIIVWYVLLNFK